MPLGLRHTREAKLRISRAARGAGKGGFNVKTTCPDCGRQMSPANLGRHGPACEKTKKLTAVFGYRPSTVELKVFERCLRAHGMNANAYIGLMESQDWKCAICRSDISGRAGSRRAANIDHDHSTGAVRGLLCTPCNVLLGSAGDDHTRLLRAAEYLKRHVEGWEIDPYTD